MSDFIIFGCGKIGNEYASILKKLGHNIKLAFGKNNSDSHIKLAKKYNTEFSSDLNIFNNHDFNYDGIIISIPPSENLEWINKIRPTNILIEKPGKNNSFELNLLNKDKHKIFIAYNRKFYKSFSHLNSFVKRQINPCNVTVNIPESISPGVDHYGTQKPYNLIYNSCHIISILRSVFGDLNFKKTFNSNELFINNSALLHAKTSLGHFINLMINLDEFSNTSINVKGDKDSIILKPIEESQEITGIESYIDQKNNIRRYSPIISKKETSYCEFGFKPGFYLQVKDFASFCAEGKNSSGSLTDIKEGIEIIKEIEFFLS